MPKAINSKAKKGAFLMEHVVKFGLKVMERCPNTGEVVSVRCQFCIYFGPEEDPAKPRQHAKNRTKKSWVNNWRSELYRKHHLSEHHSTWQTYDASSYQEKLVFFDNKIAFKNTILHHINHSNAHLQFDINASIVDTLIGDMFFRPDDHGEVTQQSALKLFHKKGDDYQVIISNPMQFQLAISHIARGSSFRQIAGIVAETKRITGIYNRSAFANFRSIENWISQRHYGGKLRENRYSLQFTSVVQHP
jgi:hypothetical protein